MASPTANDSDEFFRQGGGNGEYDNAEEHVREADFVDQVGGGVGEDVAAEDDGEEAEHEVAHGSRRLPPVARCGVFSGVS